MVAHPDIAVHSDGDLGLRRQIGHGEEEAAAVRGEGRAVRGEKRATKIDPIATPNACVTHVWAHIGFRFRCIILVCSSIDASESPMVIFTDLPELKRKRGPPSVRHGMNGQGRGASMHG